MGSPLEHLLYVVGSQSSYQYVVDLCVEIHWLLLEDGISPSYVIFFAVVATPIFSYEKLTTQ